jgi:hypothetical protein
MKIIHVFAGIIIILILCAIGYVAFRVQNPGAAVGGIGILGAILQGWKSIFSGKIPKKLEEQVTRIEQKYDPRIATLEAELREKEMEIDRLTQLKLTLLQRNRDLELDKIAQRAAQRRADVNAVYAAENEQLLAAHQQYQATGDPSGYRRFLEMRNVRSANQ